MRSQSQILMFALAIVFAVALALTVALICLSAMQTESSDDPPTSSILSPPTYEPIYSEPLLLPTDEPIMSTTADLGNGLRFQSTGGGTCRLEGIGSCTDSFVIIPEYAPSGERVTAIAPRALMGCTTLTAVQIPHTVWSIGALAFADCPNLIYLSVSDQNPAYTDYEGILYSADGKTLILYPPMRAGNTAYISSDVVQIAEMAFYRCSYLTCVRYAGSPSDWDSISIGARNYSLTASAMIFERE